LALRHEIESPDQGDQEQSQFSPPDPRRGSSILCALGHRCPPTPRGTERSTRSIVLGTQSSCPSAGVLP
jgi:hypothetical protein